MFEGIYYHNQLKHFVYTANPDPAPILPDYSKKVNRKVQEEPQAEAAANPRHQEEEKK